MARRLNTRLLFYLVLFIGVPVAVGIVAGMQSVFSQALGPMGEGMRWMTFDAAEISSCEEGVFWIDYDGEQYDYRTPIPGCP